MLLYNNNIEHYALLGDGFPDPDDVYRQAPRPTAVTSSWPNTRKIVVVYFGTIAKITTFRADLSIIDLSQNLGCVLSIIKSFHE
jgi:hypothetical protein